MPSPKARNFLNLPKNWKNKHLTPNPQFIQIHQWQLFQLLSLITMSTVTTIQLTLLYDNLSFLHQQSVFLHSVMTVYIMCAVLDSEQSLLEDD